METPISCRIMSKIIDQEIRRQVNAHSSGIGHLKPISFIINKIGGSTPRCDAVA